MKHAFVIVIALCLAMPLAAETGDFRVSVNPPQLQLAPGPPVRFEVRVRRMGWQGPLDISFETPPGVVITPANGQIEANDNDRSFAISATAMASGAGMLVIKVQPTEGGEERVERVPLSIAASPAFSIRFPVPSVALTDASQTVVLEAVSENGWNGEITVELTSAPGVTVTPMRLTMRVPGNAEVNIAGRGAGGPGQLLVTAFAGSTRKNAQLTLQPPMNPAPIAAPAWRIAQPDRLLLESGEQKKATFALEGAEGWNGRLQVMARPHPAVDVVPPVFMLSNPGMLTATIQVTLRAPLAPGARLPHLIFDVTTDAGGPPRQIAVDLDVPQDRQAPPPQPPAFPSGPLQDSGAPIPPTPPEFTSAAAQVVRENLPLDGLAEAITRSGSVISPEQATRQLAFLEAYDALIAELRNPTSFAALDGDALDAEIFAALAEESGVFARDRELREALVQVAALTPQLLLQSDIPLLATNSGIPPFRPGQPADYSAARSKVELLVMQIFLARASAGIQGYVTGPARSALDALNNAIDKIDEKLGGDKTPGRAKRLLKHLMIVTAAVTVADILAKAAIAFLPNEITAFYAEINGVRRNEGDPPVTIQLGGEASVKLFLETKSPGGQIVTPSEVAGWVFSAVSGTKKFDDFLDRILGTNKGGATDELKKQVRDEFIKRLEKVWARLTGLPSIKQWLASLDKSFDVKPFYNKPVEVNSNRVALIEARSPALIEIVERGGYDKQYFIKGKNNGQQAGYHVALKQDLVERLMTASKVPLGRLAVVNVGKPDPPTPPGKPCRYDNSVLVICPDFSNGCIGVTVMTPQGIECALPR